MRKTILILLLQLCMVFLAEGAAGPPQITTQPQSQAVGAGTPVTLSVAATGTTPLAYQWYRNDVAMPGATLNTLTLTNGSVLNAGDYFVSVTNILGATNSVTARITVDGNLTFRLLALRTNGFVAIDVNTLVGDDRGGMAVSANSVFLNGDTGTGRWRKSDLTSSSRTPQRFDALISDLRTEKAYTLANGATPLTALGAVTSLLELDDSGTVTANRIDFSTPITIGGSSVGFFAGYGRVIIADGGKAYNIDIPSGAVTDLGAVDISFHQTSENFTFNNACWGIVEYFDDDLSLVYVQSSAAIVRTRVRDGLTTDVARFATSSQGLSDMASFTFSPSFSRWYYHYENGGMFGSRAETLGWAKALYTTDPNLPQITFQPTSLTVYAGTPVALSIGVGRHSSNVSFQWRINGTDIPGATNQLLVLSNPQVADSGQYTAVVSNESGEVVSLPGVITILSAVPRVTSQPKDQAAILGGSVIFSFLAEGRPPLAYQWRFNGSNISGAVTPTLLVTNIQAEQVGSYSVQITNSEGTNISDGAQLQLITPLPENASFRVVSLGTSNARIVDDASLVSSELGGIATSLNKVFYQGQFGTASFELEDLSNGTSINRFYNSLFSDLRTGNAYVLGRNSVVVDWNSGSTTHLLELDPAGRLSGRRIALSSTIPLPGFNQNVGFFSGYGQFIIYNGTNFYTIGIPSGVVANLGAPTTALQHNFSQSWAYWGIAENFGGVNYVVYARNNTTIVRSRVPDGTTTNLATFSGIGQMASISASPYLNRWYFHYPGSTPQFGGASDTLGFADAVFEIKQADHYDFGEITIPQVINQPIAVTISARDGSGNVVTNYLGSVDLSGFAAVGGGAISVSPTVASNFVNGVWTGQVVVAQSTPGMFLRAIDSAGSAGTSAQFPVAPPNDLFVTASTIPGSGTVGQPLIYSLVVSNTGPGIAHGVVLTNVLPPGVVFQSVNSSVGTCANQAGTVRCDLLDLGPVPAVVNVQVMTPTLGFITNQTFVGRSDPDASSLDDSVILVTSINLPLILPTDVTVLEQNTGTNFVSMNVRLNVPATNTVTVNYSMFNGTAIANVDFVLRNGSLSFPPGFTNQVISLGIRNDTLYETNEFFTVSFSSPVNAVLAKNTATCTIQNDDATPVVSIGNATVNEGDANTNSARFEVRLSARTGLQIQVPFYTTNGTARAGSDYVATNGTITFAANSLIQTQIISVPIIGDTIGESNEVFYVYLGAVSNALSGNLIGTGTIVNDDGFGVLDHFAFAPISSPQFVGKPVPVGITAQDFFGNTMSNFNSPVTLSAATLRGGTNTMLSGLVHSSTSSGNYTLGYSFTPTHDLLVTHLRHYFGIKISIWTEAGVLLMSQGVTAENGTWTEIPLDVPLTLSAGNTYRIATYTGGDEYYYNFTGGTNFADGVMGLSYDGFDDVFPINGDDGVRWWLVDIRYQAYVPVPMNPTTSSSFSSGLWSGNVTLMSPGTNIFLRAFDTTQHSGFSQPFDVTPFTIFSAFSIGGSLHLQVKALANRSYRLEASDSLIGSPWTEVGAVVTAGSDGVIELIDSGPIGPQRFYRVKLVP